MAMTDLGVIYREITIGDIRNLVESLLAISYLKQIAIIHQEITLLRILDIICYVQLTIKEGFALVAFIDRRIYILNYKYFNDFYILNYKNKVIWIQDGFFIFSRIGEFENLYKKMKNGFAMMRWLR